MADLIIGGNTYQSVNRVQLRKTDGTIATFIDSAVNAHSPSAALAAVKYGETGISATLSLTINNLTSPTVAVSAELS